MKSSFLFGGFVACLAMVGFGYSDADAKRLFNKGVEKATAEIAGCTDPEIQGRATLKERFTEEGIKEVEVSMFVKGLSDGKHAVHIHEAAACEPCSAAKGHHDPGAIELYSGNPNAPDSPHFNHPFHMGDLVNIEVRNGIGVMHTTTNRITLSEGRLSIFDEGAGDDADSAFIIHTNPDLYCDLVGEDELVAGCAGGPRDACGIIEPVTRPDR
ncbi:superoxide dismutase family protein [Candidatus Nitrospira neomarina]|uniref:Superoxide dismutase family protein n=1 Tax=Candidatus Nitrospira neomarina TaxID=3020899 RepID=A0AA96GJ10_9BACT|nr:superoxide dismutase family protein [Candidatus Nitrospira neomarina]WNM62212.1 superoxide dismutase family protein [Candidatus Nitrospira neomarina]